MQSNVSVNCLCWLTHKTTTVTSSVTKLIILAPQVQRLLIYKLSKLCSTVLFQLQMDASWLLIPKISTLDAIERLIWVPSNSYPCESQFHYDLYDLHKLIVNGFIYAEVHYVMYGLLQSAIIANNNYRISLSHTDTVLFQFLLVCGSVIQMIQFSLLLSTTLETRIQNARMLNIWSILFTMSATSSVKSGMVTGNVSMPGFIKHALQCFQHPTPTKAEHSLYHWNKPKYGAKVWFAKDTDATLVLETTKKQWVQEVIRTFLFMAEQWMLPCQKHPEPCQHNNQKQLKLLWQASSSFSTMW